MGRSAERSATLKERVVKRRMYRKPPVAEALCELRFAPATPWDPTVPPRIWEQLRSEYDGTPVAQPVLHFNFASPASASGSAQSPVDPRIHFPNAAGNRKLS